MRSEGRKEGQRAQLLFVYLQHEEEVLDHLQGELPGLDLQQSSAAFSTGI